METNLFDDVRYPRSTEIEAILGATIVGSSLTDVRWLRRHFRRCIACAPSLFINRGFDFDRLATQDDYLVA